MSITYKLVHDLLLNRYTTVAIFIAGWAAPRLFSLPLFHKSTASGTFPWLAMCRQLICTWFPIKFIVSWSHICIASCNKLRFSELAIQWSTTLWLLRLTPLKLASRHLRCSQLPTSWREIYMLHQQPGRTYAQPYLIPLSMTKWLHNIFLYNFDFIMQVWLMYWIGLGCVLITQCQKPVSSPARWKFSALIWKKSLQGIHRCPACHQLFKLLSLHAGSFAIWPNLYGRW